MSLKPNVKAPFDISYVIGLLGNELNIVKKYPEAIDVVCPVCGNKCLHIHTGKNVYHCPACDASGNMFKLASLFWGCEWKEARNRCMDEYYGSTPEERRKLKEEQALAAAAEKVSQSPLAPKEVRDKTYRGMLSLLTLTPEHEEALIKRGLSKEDIIKDGYRSYPQGDLESLCRRLQASGCALKGVPGFYMKYGNWNLRRYSSGILIPVLDEDGLISGFQVRFDVVPENGGKYIWLSSTGKNEGTGITGSRNISITRYDGLAGNPPEVAFLTEGPLKGNVIRALCKKMKVNTSFFMIALTGVSNQSQLKEILELLKAQGLKKVYIIMDMDLLNKKPVRKAVNAADKKVADCDIVSVQWHWPGMYQSHGLKGYDDLLLWMWQKKREKEGLEPSEYCN